MDLTRWPHAPGLLGRAVHVAAGRDEVHRVVARIALAPSLQRAGEGDA